MDRNRNKKAVALKYEENDPAPKVLATGRGYLADKIIKASEVFDIPLVYSPEAVEGLVYLDPGQEIPPELYDAVAKIYAFLVKIDGDLEPGIYE